MIKRLKKYTKAEKFYIVWITSLLLGFFAYLQPMNFLLSKIRQAGIVSISKNSLLENSHIVVQTLMPILAVWFCILMIFLGALWLGLKKGQTVLEAVFGKWIDSKEILEKLFYIGMWIEMIWSAFYYATFQIPCATLLVFIAMQCFAIRIVIMEHNKKEWLLIGGLVVLGIACEFYTTRGFVLRIVLFLLASKEIDVKKVMKYYLVVSIVAIGIIMLLSGIGITGTWIEQDAYRTAAETKDRYVCGFNSPNTTHYVLIRLAMVAIYVWWDKLKIWHVLVIFVANYVLYMLTDSRTGFLVGFVSCLLAVFFLCFREIRDWKIWYYLAIFMIVGLAVFSLHFLQWNFYQYDTTHECPTYVYKVNDIMFGRIHQALRFTQNIELSPIGTRQPGVYCDMGYIKLFLQEGFVFYFVYLLAIVRMLLWQHKAKDYAGYLIIVSISIRMLMESSFVPFVFQNVILLLFVGRWHELLKPLKKKENG